MESSELKFPKPFHGEFFRTNRNSPEFNRNSTGILPEFRSNYWKLVETFVYVTVDIFYFYRNSPEFPNSCLSDKIHRDSVFLVSPVGDLLGLLFGLILLSPTILSLLCIRLFSINNGSNLRGILLGLIARCLCLLFSSFRLDFELLLSFVMSWDLLFKFSEFWFSITVESWTWCFRLLTDVRGIGELLWPFCLMLELLQELLVELVLCELELSFLMVRRLRVRLQ